MDIVNTSTIKAVLFGILGAALFTIIRNRVDFIDELISKAEG